MENFEALLEGAMPALERFVKFRVAARFDAEDIIQDVCVTALQKQDALRSADAFKAWLLAIARSKCGDYYRGKAKLLELPLDSLEETVLSVGIHGRTVEESAASDTLERLGDREKQILYLYYFKDLPQDQIAARLNVPLGTVKSRLHYAKRKFRENYPYPPGERGGSIMKKLPDILPEYKITPSDLPPFAVRWEEMMGWFIVPRVGEKLSWAMYDPPDRRRTELCEMEAVGRAEVHGIEGVEIVAVETDPMENNSAGGQKRVERRFVAQLTDTHCRILAESHWENGARRCYTFLDGGPFLNSWGFGEDNCGNEVAIAPKGDIRREGSVVTTADKKFLLDVVGRCTVELGGKTYDTIRVMDVETYDEGVATEQFLDASGRTVLWRRFNRDDWAFDCYGKKWSELLPDSERLSVNGKTYVHWYDCVTDHIL